MGGRDGLLGGLDGLKKEFSKGSSLALKHEDHVVLFKSHHTQIVHFGEEHTHLDSPLEDHGVRGHKLSDAHRACRGVILKGCAQGLVWPGEYANFL